MDHTIALLVNIYFFCEAATQLWYEWRNMVFSINSIKSVSHFEKKQFFL